MFRLICFLSLIAAAALVAPSTAQAPAEPESPNASPTLCPMPVVSVGEQDSIRTLRPNPGIEYFIQPARVPCHNPLFARPQEPAVAAIPEGVPGGKFRRFVLIPAAGDGSRVEQRAR
jgi:hypothetical protein